MSYDRQPKEPFTKTERRDWAETVLDNPELLMMYAQSSGAVSSFHLASIIFFFFPLSFPALLPHLFRRLPEAYENDDG